MTRIGVFVCHCGHNIGSVVNIENLIDYARTLPNVVHADHNLFSCSEEGLSSIKNSIKEYSLEAVVVAACTPRTHEALFRRACEQAGVNKYLFEFVNIREQCSWIHAREPEAATEKAKRLIAMGVAKASLLEPQEEGEASVIPVAVVIGGGVSGLTAAASLLSQGIETHLIEKEDQLGGQLRKISIIGPDMSDAAKLLDRLMKGVIDSAKAHIHLSSRITELSGFIGNFKLTIEGKAGKKQIDAGAIILAAGARELEPAGAYGYGEIPGVVTQLEFEQLTGRGEMPDRVVFVQCVESRQPGREYCSRVCCNASLKNAVHVKSERPGATVSILHRDIMSYGTKAERLYRKASEMGVQFMRYGLDRPPKIRKDGEEISIEIYDETLNEIIDIATDLVVLAAPLTSNEDASDMAKLLKVPIDKEGFFLEAHVKLRPVEFATDGVFICGSARWPSLISECISQGMAAAAKASIPIREGRVEIEAITAEVTVEKCAGCGNCVISCPYEAIEIQETEGRRSAAVIEAQCKGCGTCVAACHNDAIQQKGFTTHQLGAMIDALIKNALEDGA